MAVTTRSAAKKTSTKKVAAKKAPETKKSLVKKAKATKKALCLPCGKMVAFKGKKTLTKLSTEKGMRVSILSGKCDKCYKGKSIPIATIIGAHKLHK